MAKPYIYKTDKDKDERNRYRTEPKKEAKPKAKKEKLVTRFDRQREADAFVADAEERAYEQEQKELKELNKKIVEDYREKMREKFLQIGIDPDLGTPLK